ncbi:MAG: hypothetical protein ACJA08_002830 [Cyclobacteriaceae bacterium]|jgi:hypothetical protein
MLKFLLIIFLISYVVYKLGGFLVRMLFINATQQQNHKNTSNTTTRKRTSGNVNLDYVPEEGKKGKTDFKGGDYVEYEEVKE